MHPVFAALLFSFLALAGAPEKPALKDLNKNTCPAFFQSYICAHYQKANDRGTDQSWPKVVSDACDHLPFCGGDAHCRFHCSRLLHNERKLVCEKCKAISLMAEPAAPQWPDLFSDSAADPAKSAAPARHETNPAPCVGAASCQKAGGGTTRAGESEAHGRRLQFEAAARDARDNTASSITGAVKMLKRLESVAALSGSSGEAAHVAADQRLVKRAQEALGPVQRGTFTFNDAQKAYDPGVRTELTFAAESASQSDDFTQESGRLKKAEGEFHGLALESDQRVGALGSRFAVDSSLVGAPGSSASREFVSRSSLGAEARGASSVLGLLGIGGGGRGHSPALESPKAEFESWPGSHGRASADSLRDRLKHNLAAKTHGEALDATAFGADGLAPVPLAGLKIV